MNELEKTVLNKFKSLLLDRVVVHKLILFGSRARGDADRDSDMDVVVVLNDGSSERDFDSVSECAWEAGFESGIVVVPVVYTREECENSPERSSLLAQAVVMEGVTL
ncbi:MAG: nucleotidyltransferase domain-containing protein [Nitrospirae bacterium]|nr:nucleotidyltransferase domain-containing protein [Nitrospirota bacterium]